MLDEMKLKVRSIGKASWRPMLEHLVELHEGSIHAPCYGLPYQWEETAPERELGILYGHWETVHIALDALTLDNKHGIHQILNSLLLQQPDGLIPGHIAIVDQRVKWTTKSTFPPLWPIAIHDHLMKSGNRELIQKCFEIIKRQIGWFENERHCEDGGYYYLDCMDRFWESGVEEGVRYDFGTEAPEVLSCIDATSHVYSMYKYARLWAEALALNPAPWFSGEIRIKNFIQTYLYEEEKGFFYDSWAIENPKLRKHTFEGFWPMVVGAASIDQTQRLINEHLLDSRSFLTPHPLPTVALNDPHFSSRSWRGAVYNSMTYWVAKGCIDYERYDAADILLEKALSKTTEQYQATGAIWECYHPTGERPTVIARLPLKVPCRNHIGHNPLIAMTDLWSKIH